MRLAMALFRAWLHGLLRLHRREVILDDGKIKAARYGSCGAWFFGKEWYDAL